MQKYTLLQFVQDFATNNQCLAFLYKLRWPNGVHCETCEKVTPHYLIEKRKAYSCQFCGAQVYPTAGSIFHKSRTPLPVWFYVVYQMAQTRCGISAKQIERETGVTYKTAWRMCQLVRACLVDVASDFAGTVEVDETYVGGKPRKKGQSKRGRGTNKTPVLGIVERKGRIRAVVVADVKRKTVLPIMQDTVEDGVTIYTDEFTIYETLKQHGYTHDFVKHGEQEYVKYTKDGVVHTNSLEGFWGHVKGGIKGVYHGVGKPYLQRYLDEYSFRYSHRDDEKPMFFTFLDRIATGGRHDAKLT